jgi:predicted aspartyl protease
MAFASAVAGLVGVALAASPAALAAGATPGSCELKDLFTVPTRLEHLSATVPSRINGTEARLMVDTGAFFSTLSKAAATRLNLPAAPVWRLQVDGVAGPASGASVRVRDFVLGDRPPVKDVNFAVLNESFGDGAIGVLGENMLKFTEVEYDFSHGALRFKQAKGDCAKTNLAYWAPGAGDYIEIQAIGPNQLFIVGEVKVNGHSVKATFDTGANRTILSESFARRIGIRPPARTGSQVSGDRPNVVKAWATSVDSFSIGAEEIKNTQLLIGKLDNLDEEMVIGMDFFLSHRVLVSPRFHRLYFTYTGGPVFQPEDVGPATAASP